MPAVSDYARIAADITAQIEAGTYQSGDRLPSINALAAEYQVGVSTVKMALVWLEARELIIRRQGKGVFVA